MKERDKSEQNRVTQCQIKAPSKTPFSSTPNAEQTNWHLKAGDTVQIHPMEEILKTLNENMEFQHVWFMPGMAKYCGREYKVLKKVNYIFDERAWKMLKCKSLVILDGLICKGNDLPLKYGCDRGCYFFWKEAWLRKV